MPQQIIVYRPGEYALYQFLADIGPWPLVVILIGLIVLKMHIEATGR